MYTHFLICYDIPNTPKRTKFAEMLKDLGLVALQKSVFYGALTATERHALDFSSRKLLGAEDKCLCIPCVLKPEDFKKSIGYENFKYSEPDSYGFI